MKLQWGCFAACSRESTHQQKIYFPQVSHSSRSLEKGNLLLYAATTCYPHRRAQYPSFHEGKPGSRAPLIRVMASRSGGLCKDLDSQSTRPTWWDPPGFDRKPHLTVSAIFRCSSRRNDPAELHWTSVNCHNGSHSGRISWTHHVDDSGIDETQETALRRKWEFRSLKHRRKRSA